MGSHVSVTLLSSLIAMIPSTFISRVDITPFPIFEKHCKKVRGAIMWYQFVENSGAYLSSVRVVGLVSVADGKIIRYIDNPDNKAILAFDFRVRDKKPQPDVIPSNASSNLLGFTMQEYIEAGYVYVPYIPLTSTPYTDSNVYHSEYSLAGEVILFDGENWALAINKRIVEANFVLDNCGFTKLYETAKKYLSTFEI